MTKTRDTVVSLPCLCASLRRAARSLTQYYENMLRPFGLRATQFTILQVLATVGEVPQGDLGRILALDTTTLTRTLQIMRQHRWVAERRGDDRRERWLRLDKEGQASFQRALPAWQQAQAQLERKLGNKSWHDLLKLSGHVTGLVIEQGDLS